MEKVNYSQSLDIHSLLDRYRTGSLAPADAIASVYDRIERYADPAVWIYLAPQAETQSFGKPRPATIAALRNTFCDQR